MAFAQQGPGSGPLQAGGVDKEGSWYVGEGLEQGDFFSYELCHFSFNECQDFEMDFWIKGKGKKGTEDVWLVEAVVYDGNKILKGDMELGTVAPEPVGGSKNLVPYRTAFKSSIAWLTAFASSESTGIGSGPKEFTAKSWGKIGNIGGQQIVPFKIEDVSTPAKTFEDAVIIAWTTGGYSSNVWVVDEFPFPVKAKTFVHVSEGIPPTEYEFELLTYKQNVQENPFKDVVSTAEKKQQLGCPDLSEPNLTDIDEQTKKFKYLMDVKYGPPEPMVGCDMKWLISFKSKFDQTTFLNEVHWDLRVLNDNQEWIRSIANEQGRDFLFSPSGQLTMKTEVKEDPGTAHYVIWIYGTNPKNIPPPSEEVDFLEIDVPIIASGATQDKELNIPSWIKQNAGWWAEGQIGDSDFVQGIQFLIKKGIMKIQTS